MTARRRSQTAITIYTAKPNSMTPEQRESEPSTFCQQRKRSRVRLPDNSPADRLVRSPSDRPSSRFSQRVSFRVPREAAASADCRRRKGRAKCRSFPERLKGFEPSTFCMVSMVDTQTFEMDEQRTVHSGSEVALASNNPRRGEAAGSRVDGGRLEGHWPPRDPSRRGDRGSGVGRVEAEEEDSYGAAESAP